MKAVVVEKPNRVRIWEIKEPRIGNYEVLLKMRACAICNGTDLKIVEGLFPNIVYPVILGHEGVGEVVEIGKEVRSFKLGDLVLEPRTRIASRGLGSAWGHFAAYAVAQDYTALLEDGKRPSPALKSQQLVPKDIDPEEATILVTLKETLSGLMNFGFKTGMTLIVFGDGPVGCALVKFAKLLGAKLIIGIGHWPQRLEKMGSLGADYVVNEKVHWDSFPEVLKKERVDMVIDAIGKGEVVNKGLDLIREGGKIGIYGVFTEPQLSVSVAQWPNNTSLQILQWPSGHANVHNEVINYVRSGQINLKDFYSHVVRMDQISEGFQLVQSREAFKVVVDLLPRSESMLSNRI